MDGYKHIQFKKHWEITGQCSYQLGECHALVQAISNIPLRPKDRDKLLRLSLIKGARATTAIEGNTLSEEEIEKIQEGWKLPPSKEYLEIEVKNILDAFNALMIEIVDENRVRFITPDLIKDFHRMIGKNLGEHFDAIPGKFRKDNRIVGPYLAPDYQYVNELVKKLCLWIQKEFQYNEKQDFATAVIQAIITHVYIEWIHPFGDGNGRTGRLLEFYILLRAGLPSIVSHILSNFYNETRPIYYRQLDSARKKKDLTGFIQYAVEGFRDGLKDNFRLIQESQFIIFWHNYIYEAFADFQYTKKEAFKRKRELMLSLPIDSAFSADEITMLTPRLAKKYAKVSKVTVLRDLKELQELNLIVKEKRKYCAKIGVLKALMPSKKA
jgi:Fic family protein